MKLINVLTGFAEIFSTAKMVLVNIFSKWIKLLRRSIPLPIGKKDYKMLKHIRWVRNQIAHDTSDAPFSTEADLEFTNAFYDRIINQNDPFSHLRKAEQRKTYANNNYYFPPKSSDNSFHTQLPDTSNDSSSHGPLAVISIIAGIIIIILIVFSLINMNL